MAFPTILFDTATGSNSQCSGAGPATALFGSGDASSNGTGLIVTVTAGTDLSGVATDGSHAILFNDGTAGNRNWGRIVGKAGSGGATPTVTVSEAFGANITTRNWAIGGKLASLSTCALLLVNNGTSGDAMPGWIIELAGSQSHAFTATITLPRPGNTTDGPITIRTAAGYSARAILTWNNNGTSFTVSTNSGLWHFEDLEFQNTNATKTSAIAITSGNPAGQCKFLRVKCADATNKYGRFISASADVNWRIVSCEVGNTTLSNPLTMSNNFTIGAIVGCWFHNNAGSGTISLGTSNGAIVAGNLFTNNTGAAISSTASSAGSGLAVVGNTIEASSGDGITITAGGGATFYIVNNLITNCGGTAVNFGADTAARLSATGTIIDCNNTFNNAAAYSPAGYGTNDPGLDPGYVNAAGLDWGIGTALVASGFPLAAYPGTATRSYVDIGAAQRIAAVGALGMVIGQSVRRGSSY